MPTQSANYDSDLRRFQAEPIAFLREIGITQGDIAEFRIGRYKLRLLVHPEAIRSVLVTHSARFVKGPGLLRTRPSATDF